MSHNEKVFVSVRAKEAGYFNFDSTKQKCFFVELNYIKKRNEKHFLRQKVRKMLNKRLQARIA